MIEISYRSDILVIEDEATAGGDRAIARRAWVERPGETSARHKDTPEGWAPVIRTLTRQRHTSPLEAGYLSVYVEAPAVVWWEWTRHRFMSLNAPDQSFSLESGRYKVLDGEFYVPPLERPIVEPPGFKPMRPELIVAFPEEHDRVVREMVVASESAWASYQKMVGLGVAREAARLVLPFNVYYAGYVSGNPLTWLHFLSLRTAHPQAEVVSYPQWEIRQAADRCEAIFESHWPILVREWRDNGRKSP